MNKNNDNQIDNPTNGRTFNWINEISPTDNTYKESSINNENKKPSRKYIFATAFGYIVHSFFSFKSHVSKKNFLRYIQVIILSIFFATCFSFLLGFFIENRLIIVIVVWIGIIISNYILHSKWTFS